MRYFIVALILGLLTACSTGPGSTPEKDIVVACTGYTGVIEKLTPFKPAMSEGQKAVVSQVIAVVDPLCRDFATGASDALSASDALRLINAEVARLLVVQGEFGQ